MTDVSTADPAQPARSMSVGAGLLRTARPKQWVKNVLVFAAPGAAGVAVLLDPDTLVRVVLTFVAFCLAASGTYFLNDAMDVEADRVHPTKRLRPIAAGVVPVSLAYVCAAVLLVGSVLLTLTFVNVETTTALLVYVVTTTSYSIWLKHVAIIDIVLVAAGFILRAVAGGTAADVVLSEWFLIVTSFGSLFMVTGKRYAEHVALGDSAVSHRRSLEEYSTEFLGYIRTTASAVTIVAYCLWAFEKAGDANHPIWYQLSIAPFLVALYRYAMRLEEGHGGAPEEVVLGDRFLQVAFLCWLAVFALGVYVNG
ncbi:MAG: decaprenyl-phosphate phosphoribosyltransferase [Acidimicrobiia bacterium]|nr:decaprenyl-phosphate phosphoribosyltransferase [Acidimicrobiia bacterium]